MAKKRRRLPGRVTSGPNKGRFKKSKRRTTKKKSKRTKRRRRQLDLL